MQGSRVHAAVHAEWFPDLRTGAFIAALSEDDHEAYMLEPWVSSEQEAWVYAAIQATAAAFELVPDLEPWELVVAGDRPDLSQLVRRTWPGRLGEALRIRDERWPGVSHKCKRFTDRVRLRAMLREFVEVELAAREGGEASNG
jgi:hypothetical protein